MKRSRWVAIIVIIFILLSYQNCGPAPKSSNETGTKQTQYLTADPLVDCRLADSRGVTIRRIRSYSSNSLSTQAVLEDQPYYLDCNGSGLGDGTEATLRLDLVNPSQGAGVLTTSDGIFDLRFADVGSYPLDVIATDTFTGRSTRLSFQLDVRCSQDSTLNVSAANIQVTPSATQGFFDFAVSGVTGGVGTYQYAWDFNGDQRTDLQPLSGGWTLWSTRQQISNVYSMFAGTRNVTVYVRDSCNIVKQVTNQRSFAIPLMTNPIQSPDFTYYVQGRVRPLSPATPSAWTQVDISARQPSTVPDQRLRVLCSYPKVGDTRRRSLSVTAHNTYGSSSQVSLIHGLNFKIENIPDSGAMGIVNMSSGTPLVTSLNYLVSETGDISPSIRYSQNQPCTIQSLEIERKLGVGTCTGEPGNPSKVVRILGQLSCPSLRSSDGKTVQLNETMFYCEAGDVQHCIGGPGGVDPGDPIPGW